eukprot:3779029-Rhodomonas_salina.1
MPEPLMADGVGRGGSGRVGAGRCWAWRRSARAATTSLTRVLLSAALGLLRARVGLASGTDCRERVGAGVSGGGRMYTQHALRLARNSVIYLGAHGSQVPVRPLARAFAPARSQRACNAHSLAAMCAGL